MKRIMTILLVGLLMVSLAGCEKKVASQQEDRTESQWAAIRTTAEEIVLPMAEIYGIMDMQFSDTEDKGFSEVCIFVSESYGKLSHEEKLGLLADVSLAVYKEKPFSQESGISDKGLELQVESGGVRYMQFTSDGKSILWEDGKDVLTTETAYAQLVEGSLKASMEKLDKIIEAGDKVDAELEIREQSAKGACLSCGKSYREGTTGAKIIAKTGYCSNKCQNRMEEK